jgi:uncharacterized protein
MRSPAGARVLTLGLLIASASVRAETAIPPPPEHWVTDRAAFLSPAVTQELDARLGDYAQRTGHQVLVYIDLTTGGVPIEDWGGKTFERWKVGRKGIDDGAVLFVFKDDHKLRIEVGYGLEAQVPDIVASRIINDQMVPLIRSGDNDGAVKGGVDALLGAIGASDQGTAPAKRISGLQLVLGGIALLLFIVLAITHPALAWLMLMSLGSGRGGRGGGGGFSGGGGRSGGGGASGSW